MKAIISREVHGAFAEVGTSNQTVVSHYKTERGVLRYAAQYARGSRYRVQFFTDAGFYGEPYKVIESRKAVA